jgi:putative SOS response-associated peptidase YedK
MCNHYRQAILQGLEIPGWSRDQFSEIRIPLRFHNMLPDVYPDREGLVVRLENGAPGIAAMRWGFPPPPNAGAYYVTNVRNLASAFWKPWLKVEHRCLVPVAQFAEPDPEKPKPRAERWFARSDGQPMFFAGVWRTWDGDRGPKSKPVSGPHQIFSFLTCEPNGVVKPIHPKAMPVILAPGDVRTWLTAPPEEALKLQRPLPDADLTLLEREAA